MLRNYLSELIITVLSRDIRLGFEDLGEAPSLATGVSDNDSEDGSFPEQPSESYLANSSDGISNAPLSASHDGIRDVSILLVLVFVNVNFKC